MFLVVGGDGVIGVVVVVDDDVDNKINKTNVYFQKFENEHSVWYLHAFLLPENIRPVLLCRVTLYAD